MNNVSIILPVFSPSITELTRCIDSIQNQTYDEYELIIIHDPWDNDKQVFQIYDQYSDDPRVKVHNNSQRLGLVESLNLGIKQSNYDYIARADVDDFSHPNRLLHQIEFLTSNELDVVGTWAYFQEPNSKKELKIRKPTVPGILSNKLMYHNQIIHSTVLMSKKIFTKTHMYDEKFKHSEDYELWLRLNSLGYKLSNVPEYLVTLAPGNDSITRGNRWRLNRYSYIKCKLQGFQHYGYNSMSDLFFLLLSPLSLVISPSMYSYYLKLVSL